MATEKKRAEHGYVLPVALMLSVLFAMLTPALLFLSGNGFFHSKKNSQSQQARFLADAAYQAALQVIYRAAKTAHTTPPFPLNETDESNLINEIRQIRGSADTTDNGSYQVTDLPGSSNPEIRNGQRIYYLQAQGTAGPVVSTIRFKLLFTENASQIIVPPYYGFPNPPDHVKDLIVYDENARQYAQNQLSAALRSAAYTPNVTCTSCSTQQAIDRSIQANLQYDPLVIRVGTLAVGNNASLQFKRPDGKRLVVMADQVSLGNNATLAVQGTLTSEGAVSLGKSTISVTGDFILKGYQIFTLPDNAVCTVSGQMAVNGRIVFESGGKPDKQVTVNGLLTAYAAEVGNKRVLSALGGASIVDQLVLNNNAGLVFDNRLIVGGSILMSRKASLKPAAGSNGAGVSFVGVEKW